ncbi:type II toxin-antitoxin system RelE/ParE family toxin [Tautonia sociabilis]|uniref:Type II toxin-antitoxin system RelE/ParE family toxin n=1 Tax=Tautonia sociabilis TaxID=2080755 RepID=A0A432MMD0_9BACT|nr:type II toxin-antitoxin system RelE/ParE family toxin [Tautonia sociabilis]RUL88581.1 type II toxin-antitoxin system RelE/ParE family toxin [Tautonia sociabilis]
MSFEVRLTQRAAEDYRRLAAHLRAFLECRLRELGDSPGDGSRPVVSPPYPPGGMMHECDYIVGSEWHRFTIIFYYGQDEASLEVIGIGHVDYSGSSGGSVH